MDESTLRTLLVERNYVSAEDMARAIAHADAHHASVTEYLSAHHRITKDLLGQAMAEAFGVPYADINSRPPSAEQVHRIPESTARRYRVVVFEASDARIVIATDDPAKRGLHDALVKRFPGTEVVIAYGLPEDLDDAFIHYRKPLEEQIRHLVKGEGDVAPALLDALIADAIVTRATDIHLEPRGDTVAARFRIDGSLHDAGRFPSTYYARVVNRVKVLAQLRIDEHGAAQDGAIRWTSDGLAADLRVSVVPTIEGEKVALRVLAAYVRRFTLADLGLREADEATLLATAERPYGMVIVTGPTGSGKTTTLYACLKAVNQPEINVTTIEDPVEYRLADANQIQVNPGTDLTFAKGLRSIVRQDPDIILVGEIRDRETAEITVNAALTGHLVLSTFHANDAATAIPRLFDMGVEPFLLASTLELLIAQRLVRTVCQHCRMSESVDAEGA